MRFRAILENAQMSIGLLSKDGVVLEVNPALLHSYNLSLHEVAGKQLWDTLGWQSSPEARQLLKKAVREAALGKTVQFTTQITEPNREPATVNFSLRPIRNAAGEISYLLSESRDISDMVQTIKELRQSQRMLEQANRIASLGYWSWDIHADQVYLSDELKRVFAEHDETQADTYQDLMRYVYPEDRVVVQRTIQTALQDDRTFALQFRITRRDGAIRTLRCLGQITRDETGEPQQIFGTVQDITAIQSLETRLVESEKRYRYLVQELPNTGVILYDPNLIVFLIEGGNLLKAEEAAHRFLGKPVEQVLVQLLGETPEAESLQFFKDVFAEQSHAYEQISGDKCFSVSLVPLRNDQGEIYAGMAVFQDITQRIRVAEKLTNLAEQLKMLNHMGQVVVSNRDTQYIFKEVLTTVRKMIGADGVFIFLEKNGLLLIEAYDEASHRDLRGQGMPCTEGIGGEVWQKQQGILLSGAESRKRLFKPLAEHLGYTPLSFLSVPVTWQEQKFGVFQAVDKAEGKFNQEDLKLVESAASWTAIALGNAYQHQKLERRLAESSVTAELLQEILSASPTLNSVLQHVVDAAKNIIPAVDWAAIHLSNERDRQLQLEAISGLSVAAEDYTLAYGQGIAGQVIASGTLINVPDVRGDPRVVSIPRVTGAHSLLVAPIINRNEIGIGTITLQSSTPGQFTAEDERLLMILSRQAGLAIENARLYDAAQYGQHIAQVQRERLRQLTRQTVTAQEEERQRIARELHDEAGQSLTALKISLEILAGSLPAEMQSAQEALKEAAEQAGQTLENLRSIAHNLRPPALDRLGLNLALGGLCQQFEALTHIQTSYEGLDLPRLRNSHEITLYRFVQEALTNAAKHAEASEVRVWLETQTGQLEIHIQDNGKGMQSDPLDLEQTDQEGMGLTSMEERLKIIDGSLFVQSSWGRGTHLCARVPLRPKEALA